MSNEVNRYEKTTTPDSYTFVGRGHYRLIMETGDNKQFYSTNRKDWFQITGKTTHIDLYNVDLFVATHDASGVSGKLYIYQLPVNYFAGVSGGILNKEKKVFE